MDQLIGAAIVHDVMYCNTLALSAFKSLSLLVCASDGNLPPSRPFPLPFEARAFAFMEFR